VSLVEGDGITGHQTAHDFAERCLAGALEQVKVVRDQGPGPREMRSAVVNEFHGINVALGLGFFENVRKTLEKGFSVSVVSEYLSSFNSPAHHMLQKAGGV